MKPGEIAFTRTPFGPTSFARPLLQVLRAMVRSADVARPSPGQLVGSPAAAISLSGSF